MFSCLQHGVSFGDDDVIVCACAVQPLLTLVSSTLDDDVRGESERVLRSVEERIQAGEHAKDTDASHSKPEASVHISSVAYLRDVTLKITSQPDSHFCGRWLTDACLTLSADDVTGVDAHLLCVTCGVFCVSGDAERIEQCLAVFERVARVEPAQVVPLTQCDM